MIRDNVTTLLMRVNQVKIGDRITFQKIVNKIHAGVHYTVIRNRDVVGTYEEIAKVFNVRQY